MDTIYKTPQSRAVILAGYERRLAALPLAVESRTVETRFGPTHVLVAGPEEAPPLVLVPGSNGCALDFAEPWGFLAERQRCFFLDVPGEPNRSSECRPSKQHLGYGHWMEDVLDAFALERVAMIGMSLGGYVILKSAAAIPKRISRAVLIVPEGFCRSSPWTLLRKISWPLLRQRLAPSPANLRRFVAALSSPGSPVLDAAVDQMGRMMEHVKVDPNLGPFLTAPELAGFEAPVLLLAGGADVLFPGERLVHRAREILPNLREVIFEPGAGHIHVGFLIGPHMDTIRAFLVEENR